MAKIAMDPDQVRAMANAATRTAESMQGHMSQIVSSVRGAGWQSQAREEFIERLETLSRVNTQSMSALRLMANAANQKARQWDAKASRFNAPLEALDGAWASFLDHLNNTWQGLLNSISGVVIGGFTVIAGGLGGIRNWFDNIKFPWEDQETQAPSTPSPAPAQPTPAPEAPPAQPPATERAYPYPPNQIALKNNRNLTSCAWYARGRRPDLGQATGFGPHENGAAANYRHKFADKAFQIGDGEKGNLKDVIGVGYAITWEPNSKGSPTKYGHIAIVEEVHDNYVVYSHATDRNGDGIYEFETGKQLSFDYLNMQNIWLIP